MKRRTRKLSLGMAIDFGGSLTKIVAGLPDGKWCAMAMEPEVLEVPLESIEQLRKNSTCKFSVDGLRTYLLFNRGLASLSVAVPQGRFLPSRALGCFRTKILITCDRHLTAQEEGLKPAFSRQYTFICDLRSLFQDGTNSSRRFYANPTEKRVRNLLVKLNYEPKKKRLNGCLWEPKLLPLTVKFNDFQDA